MSNLYQTPENHRAGKPPLEGALYYGTIRRGGQTYHVAMIQEDDGRLLATSATFHEWIQRAELTRTNDD